MSDYKTIHGISIRDYTTDPDNLIVGQVWFDKTNKVLQFQAEGAGAFSTGGNMNTARRRMPGVGTQTAALVISGTADPPVYAQVESYNGSAFSEVADVNT